MGTTNSAGGTFGPLGRAGEAAVGGPHKQAGLEQQSHLMGELAPELVGQGEAAGELVLVAGRKLGLAHMGEEAVTESHV